MRTIAAVVAVGALLMLAPTARAGAPSNTQTATGTVTGPGYYARLVQLRHSGAQNGAILATYQLGQQGLIYRSTDDGKTFARISAVDVGSATQVPAPGGLCCIALFELPTAMGAYPVGTLLWAGTVIVHDTPPPRHNRLMIWASEDHGLTWTEHGQCAEGDELWEPDFHVANDGSLVCVYSDGTDAAHHSQMLSETISTDGGATFGTPRIIVRDPLPGGRPGMATAAKLPDGTWAMTNELCGQLPPCQVRIRHSADGIDWGDPADRGTVVLTASGSSFWHTPFLTWAPVGGPRGTLLLTGQIFNKSTGFAEPGSGATILANTDGGVGPWTPFAAPVSIPNPFDHPCPNYSSPVLPLDGRQMLEFATEWTGSECLVRYATGTIADLTPPPASTTTTTRAPTTTALSTGGPAPATAVRTTVTFAG